MIVFVSYPEGFIASRAMDIKNKSWAAISKEKDSFTMNLMLRNRNIVYICFLHNPLPLTFAIFERTFPMFLMKYCLLPQTFNSDFYFP